MIGARDFPGIEARLESKQGKAKGRLREGAGNAEDLAIAAQPFQDEPYIVHLTRIDDEKSGGDSGEAMAPIIRQVRHQNRRKERQA